MIDSIIIKNARTHNLKNINLIIPKNKIVVITGLSGSGKSSLAFDTIYAEGQRRYVESLSAYAKQFLELMEKPDLDFIDGLSPSIAIEQRSFSKNPRSTVGTVTEIYDYLRLLFARIGIPHCPNCKRELKSWTLDSMANDILTKFKNKKISILSPVVRGRIGTYEDLFDRLKKKGYVKFEIDGKVYSPQEIPSLERYIKHNISIIIDSFTLTEGDNERLKESIELALKESDGICEIRSYNNRHIYSEKNACPICNISIAEIEPRSFSFNSPFGACPKCEGLGFILEIDINSIIDENLSIEEGAIIAWEEPITTRTNRWKTSWKNYYRDIIYNICSKHLIKTTIPFKKLSDKDKKVILYGDDEFEGVVNNIKRRYAETDSDFVKQEIHSRFMKEIICDECNGKRLKKEFLSILINSKNIAEITDMSVREIIDFFSKLKLNQSQYEIAKAILKEINSRLEFLSNVGLGYLTLSRYSKTLSGGEAQRISLATQIGSRLSGVIYVLDEPTIGLHPIDSTKLINTLKSLRDLGNTLIIVEHDRTTIENADYLIELGPGAGIHGGEVVFSGTLEELKKTQTITALYLKGDEKVTIKKTHRNISEFMVIRGARQFNLKNINVKIPIGAMTVICGVSGSGKSTLLYEILYKGIMKKINPSFKEEPGDFDNIFGYDKIKRVVMVDQSPIGRTPRSNPATYVGFFDHIRYLFSQTPSAKRKGYSAARFSFNLKGGRCENCKGEGYIRVEMQFMPDVYIKCEECEGKRFNKDTLEIRYRDKNIAEILDMSIEEAYNFFENIPSIKSKLKLLIDVGLGYIKIGQSSTTLSGGEAQRIKLAWELSRKNIGSTLYILDEPTTGLHFHDIKKLLNVLRLLVDNGNTVVIIEHNVDVINSADWIVELGPEGGPGGGYVIYEGDLDGIKKSKKSITKNFI